MAVEFAPRPTPGAGALATKRLVLRPFRLSDGPIVETLAGDFDVAKMLDVVPYPYPAGEAARWISTHDASRDGGREYPFAIEREGELVGCVGLNRETDGLFHLGYWIGVPFWGKGFATEAARAALEFAFDELTGFHVDAMRPQGLGDLLHIGFAPEVFPNANPTLAATVICLLVFRHNEETSFLEC